MHYKNKTEKKTRTRQFRIKYVTFFKYGKEGKLQPLASDAMDEETFSADAVTLRISNQKNGHAGACIHHTAIVDNKAACPVKALSRQCTHIRQNTKNRNASICTYFDEVGMGSVIDNQIQFKVKFAAKALHYDKRGIPIDRIDTHSLRSGGACALKLAGYDAVEIKKMGHWKPKSNTFLE